jgi:hypothetical protein
MELHDIFPMVEIVEYSLYYLLSTVLATFLFFYFLYSFKTKKRKNKTYYLRILLRYPKDNAKYTAYLFSYYGKYIAKEETKKVVLSDINQSLENFKYSHDYQNVPLSIQEKIYILLGDKNV